MDYLAKYSVMSMVESLPQEYVPETDSGLRALLGYNPQRGIQILELLQKKEVYWKE